MMSDPELDRLSMVLGDKALDVRTRVLAGDALRYALMRDGDVPAAEHIATRVIELGTPAAADPDIYNALERAHITKAPNNFHNYLIALEWNRPTRTRFYQPRMSIMKPVADAITDMMVNDKYDIIEISMPPRVGKTTLGILALTWLVGRNPDSPILATGYAEKITKMFHTGIAEIYDDPIYNYQAIYPTLSIVDTSAKDLTLDFRNDGGTTTRKYKSVTCRPIDGSLTGATEARQLLYCDDLVRDIEEALNKARLDSLHEKLVTNAQSRKKEGCKELHIGTHWSLHDPMARLERQYADDPRVLVIRIPALDPETDESNFNYPYGVGFSTEYYRALRETYRENNDMVTWECVYQQNPIEREGLLFPEDELTYIYDIPDIKHNPPDDIFAFCDVAFGGNDYLCLPVAYQWDNGPPMIAGVVFIKAKYDISEPIVAGRLLQHNVQRAIFEANNGGDFYARDVAALVKAAGHQMQLISRRAEGNKSKETRIVQHSPAILGFTFLHPSSEDATPEYRQFLQNLTTYTLNGKNQNDDAPDALAGLATMLRSNLNATLKVYDRTHI
jgi:predicted phage terminase large subunit-like protein